MDEVAQGHLQELRRGTVVLACLAALREPRYGYLLIEELAEAGIVVSADTLYPLLRRLEGQGLLRSEWNTEKSRPRKFYDTTPAGRTVLDELTHEWSGLDSAVRRLIEPNGATP